MSINPVDIVERYISEAREYARAALEACIGCGYCLSACTMYRATRDPRLSPLYRLRAAARVLLEGRYTPDDVVALYTCNLCGACTLACPFSIEVLRLVHAARHVLRDKGVMPRELAKVREAGAKSGHSFLADARQAADLLVKVSSEAGVTPDEPARILYVPSPFETTVYPHVLRDTLLLLKSLGVEVTVSRRALDLGGNVAIDANSLDTGLEMLMKVIDAAEELGVEAIVLSQCGADAKLATLLRKMGLRTKIPLVSLYTLLAEKGFQVRCDAVLYTSCTFARLAHPPNLLSSIAKCSLPKDKPPFTMCCGGAGGINFIHREEPYASIRRRVYRWRFEMLTWEARGKPLVVPCVKCYSVFKMGALLAKKPGYRILMFTNVALGSASQPTRHQSGSTVGHHSR